MYKIDRRGGGQKSFSRNIPYFACLSICLFVLLTSKRLNRLGPNFVYYDGPRNMFTDISVETSEKIKLEKINKQIQCKQKQLTDISMISIPTTIKIMFEAKWRCMSV